MPTSKLTPQQIKETEDALAKASGNKTHAANALGISRAAFQGRLRSIAALKVVSSAPDRATHPDRAAQREAFLAANQRGFVGVTLPQEAIEDLRYFEREARKGRAIRVEALLQWIAKNYAITIGRGRLHRLAREAGVQPWFAGG